MGKDTRLDTLKNQLMCSIEGQMGRLNEVNAEELGAAVDMLKDCYEACYYEKITAAMEESEKEPRMYYGGNGGNGNGSSGNNGGGNPSYYGGNQRPARMYYDSSYYMPEYYEPMDYPRWKPAYASKSEPSRKMYMARKELHTETPADLEKYMHDLTDDIMELVEKATPEERELLKTKISTLANKIK